MCFYVLTSAYIFTSHHPWPKNEPDSIRKSTAASVHISVKTVQLSVLLKSKQLQIVFSNS